MGFFSRPTKDLTIACYIFRVFLLLSRANPRLHEKSAFSSMQSFTLLQLFQILTIPIFGESYDFSFFSSLYCISNLILSKTESYFSQLFYVFQILILNIQPRGGRISGSYLRKLNNISGSRDLVSCFIMAKTKDH